MVIDRIQFKLPVENTNNVIIQLLAEQNAQLGVIMDLLTQLIAAKNDDDFIEVVKDQVRLNNENMKKRLYEITARIMSEYGE